MLEINHGIEGLLSRPAVNNYVEQLKVEDFLNLNLHDISEVMILLCRREPKRFKINTIAMNEIGGEVAKPIVKFDNKRNRTIVCFTYQSEKQFGEEYPVLDIQIALWKTPKGIVKAEFVKSDDTKYEYHNRCRFWG